MKKSLIVAIVVLAMITATGTNVLGGGIADLIILGTLAIILGPLRLLEFIYIGFKYFFNILFRLLAIAGS